MSDSLALREANKSNFCSVTGWFIPGSDVNLIVTRFYRLSVEINCDVVTNGMSRIKHEDDIPFIVHTNWSACPA